MVNFQACKMLCAIMLLLGPCINKEVRLSFAIDLTDEKRKTAFKTMLMRGFVKYMENKQWKESMYERNYFLNLSVNYCYEEGLPGVPSVNNIRASYDNSECINYILEKIKPEKIDDFFLDVKISEEPSIINELENPFEEKKTLKLESIDFNKINYMNREIYIGSSWQSHYSSLLDLYKKLLKGFNYEETILFSGNDNVFKESDRISLYIASLEHITPVIKHPHIRTFGHLKV